MSMNTNIQLPGLDCGLCGSRTCEEFSRRLTDSPELIQRCIHLSKHQRNSESSMARGEATDTARPASHGSFSACGGCASACATRVEAESKAALDASPLVWQDHLGRDFDFYLEHFPEEPGPREIILPHNPMLTRELDIQKGDIMIGRPLGMSCGCPITHCGVVTEVDQRTGVMSWCVTGPLEPRQKGYKDLGYYIAEGYEGLVKDTRCELKIGMRYYFQPRMCMLQWRHSGLLNYLSRTEEGYQVRVEGLWIG